MDHQSSNPADLDRRVKLADLDIQETPVHPVFPVRTDHPDHLVSMARKVSMDHQDVRGSPALRERRVSAASLENLDEMDTLVPLV